MAYADQKMSGNKMTALIIVAILHVLVGYALVSGLAYSAVEKLKERVETFDVAEEKPPEDEPPPPPPEDTPQEPPPIVAPPPPISFERPAPAVEAVREAPIAPPAPVFTAAPAAPPAPPPAPPAAPKFTAKAASPKGSPGSWATTDDYPARALREERAGTTRFRVSIGPDGRVTDCQITGSSGHPDLDEATCKNVTRRARFNPAMDGDGKPTTGSFSSAVRWVIPEG